jgi:hypothetical protein
MIRRILVPSGPLLGAVAIVKSEVSADEKKEKNLICKPSALPIYTSLVDRWLSQHSYFLSHFITTTLVLFLADVKRMQTVSRQNSPKPSRKESKLLDKKSRR